MDLLSFGQRLFILVRNVDRDITEHTAFVDVDQFFFDDLIKQILIFLADIDRILFNRKCNGHRLEPIGLYFFNEAETSGVDKQNREDKLKGS